jgi:DNA repair exonuclease SbcCD nuclease subunit
MLPEAVAAADRAAVEITKEEIGAARWDYVALGHYHVYREIETNVFYSGSIDYTSANTWGELHEQTIAGVEGKGFVERNLITGAHTFHQLPPSRPLVDLKWIVAAGLTVSEVDERIRATVEGYRHGIDDKIVRLVVKDIARHVARELDHKAIREYKRRALNFHLDLRRPETLRLHASGSPGGRRPSLNEIVREKLMARPLDADVERVALVERAMAYLDEAQTAPAPAPMLLDV